MHFLYPLEGRMVPVFRFYPVLTPAILLDTIKPLRDDALKTMLAGGTEQIWPSLARLIGSELDTFGSATEQLLEVCLAHAQRQLGKVVTIERQDVESVE